MRIAGAVVVAAVMVGVVVAVALAFAACSGGKSSSDKTTTARNPQAAELDALSKKFAASSFKAQFNLSGTGDEPLNGTMTLFKAGSDRFRFDVATTQDGQPVALTMIQTKDQSVFCLQDAGALAPILGVDAGGGVCFKNDPTSDAGGLEDLTDTFSQLSSGDVDVTGKSTRTIAGLPAQCYQYTDNSSGDKSETCFSGDGIPLYDKTTTGSDTTTFEATSVQGSVQDSDFNVPYAVKDLPDFSGDD